MNESGFFKFLNHQFDDMIFWIIYWIVFCVFLVLENIENFQKNVSIMKIRFSRIKFLIIHQNVLRKWNKNSRWSMEANKYLLNEKGNIHEILSGDFVHLIQFFPKLFLFSFLSVCNKSLWLDVHFFFNYVEFSLFTFISA